MNKLYLMRPYKSISIYILLLISCALTAQENRAIDGTGNNITYPTRGASGTQLQRITTVNYLDGVSIPDYDSRPNPREISNILFEQTDSATDQLALSDFVWVFGQFIDHDVSFVENFDFETNPEESAVIFPPVNDEYFSLADGDFIPMMRSREAAGTGTSVLNPREHSNSITSFIDGSAIYGSDQERADWLRSFEDGKLKTSSSNNLPWNTVDGEFNSNISSGVPFMDNGNIATKYYVAGDARANENPLLLAMHTMFLREHNKVCDEIAESSPSLNDEQIYQQARKIVSGKLQAIVYNEWLPVLNIEIPAYTGYVDQIDPTISNVFSAAAFRLGHTLINSNIIRMRNDGETVTKGNISLKDAFFNPLSLELAGGVDPYVKGMATQIQQDFDCKVIGDVRNFLFGTPGMGGLDLAAININRGRERGIADYNTIRFDFGLPKISKFTELCSDPEISVLLAELYTTVDNIDPWVGMLAENHLNDALFGELVMLILEKQFRALRDGDRYYFENDQAISTDWKEVIRNSTMRSIIMRNTSINLMQDNVFRAMDHENIPNGPELPSDDLFTKVYPNPVVDHFYAKVYSDSDQTATLEIFDNAGFTIQSMTYELVQGENSLLVFLDEHLAGGVYNLHTYSETNFSITRFIKL